MIDPPQIVQTARQKMACVHITVPREQIRTVMGPGLMEVKSALDQQGIKPTGPWFTHHLHNPTDIFDFEICLPVDVKIAPNGRVKPGEWPAITVARTVYHGPYEQLGAGWGEFEAWIKSNGHQSAADLWERYLTDPGLTNDPAKYRTELNRPIVK